MVDRSGPSADSRGKLISRDVVLEAVRFAVVGGANTATCFLLVWVLHGLLGSALAVASAAGYAVATVQSYVVNRNWTFARSSSGQAVPTQMAAFVAVSMICGLIFTGLNVGLHHFMVVAVSTVAATAMVVPISFLLNRNLVFRRRQDALP